MNAASGHYDIWQLVGGVSESDLYDALFDCVSMCSGSTYCQHFPTARLAGSKMTVYGACRFTVNASTGKISVTSASSSTGGFKIHVTRVEGWRV